MFSQKKFGLPESLIKSVAEAIKTHTVPKTEKDKKLAALAEPKDKITHKDVMVGRGVIAKEEAVFESHFKVGDEVVCKASGMEGEVVKVDKEQKGKYYTVKREDGKTVKYAPDELKAEKEDMKEAKDTGASKKKEEKFHMNLDKLVHKTFGHSPAEKKEKMKEEVDLEEANVKKYAKMGATNRTTHFVKNTTTGKIESPHVGIKDAERGLTATQLLNPKHEFSIVRAQKMKKEEVDLDEADTYSIENPKTKQVYHLSKYPITKYNEKYRKIKAAGGNHVHATIYKNGKPVSEGVNINEAPVDGVAAGSMEGDKHLCATKVMHREWKEGKPLFSQHAEPAKDGTIAWYDVMFEHGIEKKVPTSELEILVSESHMNHKKKK